MAKQQKRSDKRGTKTGEHKDYKKVKKVHIGKEGIAPKEHKAAGDKSRKNVKKRAHYR